MKTMNGFMNELVVRKTSKRNWRTRCGSFLVAILATCYTGDAFSEVQLTPRPGLGENTTFNAITPDPVNGPIGGSSMGNGRGNGKSFFWDGDSTGRNLNALEVGILEVGISANTVTVVNNVTTYGQTTIGLNSDLAFTAPGGGDVYFLSDLTWLGAGGSFSVEGGATGTVHVGGAATLTLGNHLSVNDGATLVIDIYSGGTSTSGGIIVSTGSNNSGTIDIKGTVLTLNGDLGGSGTINLDPYGMLMSNYSTNSQNIQGSHSANSARGLISVINSTEFHGNLINDIGFTGGGNAYIFSDNTATLNSLYIYNGTNVILEGPANLGNAAVYLYENGGLSKDYRSSTDNGDLTIANNIHVGGEGMLNAITTRAVIGWTEDADQLADYGERFKITGEVSGGSLLHINDRPTATGTVVLTHDNRSYVGDFQIHRGILEISNQTNLGKTTNYVPNTVIIGDTTYALERSVFRVVGDGGNGIEPLKPTTIEHWIDLETQRSFYEVFTNAADKTKPDRDRFTVLQTGQINGSGSLNKSGDGILELGTFNNYSGDTIIWHGVLRISDANQISNNHSAKLFIGGETLMEDHNFRPVFETKRTELSTGSIVIDAGVVVNLTNSTVRTTGVNNETIFSNTITTGIVPGDGGVQPPYPAVLNKDGAGIMTLHGDGKWGRYNAGELKIHQGTVQFARAGNLASGDITIGNDPASYKDTELVVDTNNQKKYEAVLKLEDNCTVGIGNRIILDTPVLNGYTSDSGSFISVGNNSVLTLSSPVVHGVNVTESDLNKTGKGELILKGSQNAYGGWTNVYEGILSTITPENLIATKGVDLVNVGTLFDMSAEGASQTLKGLRGGIENVDGQIPAEDWTRKFLIGSNTLTLDLVNFKAADKNNKSVFYGHISGNGTLIKTGIVGSTFASGFTGFNGTFDIQAGTLQTLTDTTLTGIKGKTGTFLDIRDNQLTINIGSSQQYDGTIISSYPILPYTKNTISRPSIVKDGAGTLTTSFYDRNINTGAVQSFQGDLTIKQGNIISTSDFYMAGNSNLTFYVNPDLLGSVNPLVLDVSKYSAVFKPGGTTGKETSTVHVYAGDNTTGWTTSSGTLTVGKILGNDKSDYTGLKAATTDSLYYTLGLQDIYGTGRHDLYVNLNVTGFGGVGNTFNTQAAGEFLDNARVTDLTKTGLAPLIQELWAFGSNVTDLSASTASSATTLSRAERIVAVRGLLQQIAPDTIANGMFMGLDQPWRVAFDRLNLDSQMVYVAPPQSYPQQYRGQIITNMRNLWFTPTVQTVSARSDGNARKFGIDRPGYKLGFDKRVAQNTSVGFQLAYSSPKLREGDDRIEGSDFQVGLYGGSMVGSYIELKGFIGFGHQNFKSNRNVYVNLPGYSSQSLVAHGRYDGDTFNFSFDISRPLFLGFAILRPTIGLDSEHAFRYAFTESGSPIAMKFERASLSRTRARFGLSLETTTLDRAIFTGRLGYSALLGGHDFATANGVMVGTNVPAMSVRSVAVGKSFFEAGVGTKIFLNPVKTLALVGNYDATVANRWAEHQGLVGFTYIY